jgi:archaellum component FlaC
MTTDERIEKLGERIDALTMNVELLAADAQTLLKAAQQDGENIRALARIAEIHERRLSALEDGPSAAS